MLLFLTTNMAAVTSRANEQSHFKWNANPPGGSPLYKPYSMCCPQGLGFCAVLALKHA